MNPKYPSKTPDLNFEQFIDDQAALLLSYPNINSVGLGFKEMNGKSTDILCIKYTVDQKVGPESIRDLGSAPIPRSFEINGVSIPSDIIERKYVASPLEKLEATNFSSGSSISTLQPGMGIGTPGNWGTLGCVVKDIDTKEICILSNWHVLGHDHIGTSIFPVGGSASLGNMKKSYLGSKGDCAVSSCNLSLNPSIKGLNIIPQSPLTVDDTFLHRKVIKSGLASGVTHGVIETVFLRQKQTYDNGQTQRINGFEIHLDHDFPPADGEISKPGDSGAIWLLWDEEKGKVTDQVVGLHYAGEDEKSDCEHALACHAEEVFTKLNITLKL